MIIWNAAFNIAYKDGTTIPVEAVADNAGARLVYGSMDDFNMAKRLPKFASFLQAIGVGGVSYLPVEVASYDFRFSAIATNGHVNVCGSSDTLDGEPVINDSAIYDELRANDLFSQYFESGSVVLINTTYVDYDPDNPSAEASNLIAGLEYLGREVKTFTDVSASGVTAAIEGVSHLIIPELEENELVFSAEAKEVIKSYVNAGNKFLAFYATPRMLDMVNYLFDWSISEGSEGSGTYNKTDDAAALGYGSGPSSIPVENATYGVAPTTLPDGGVSIYKEETDNSAVTVIPYGGGQVILFGWDWYNAFPVGDNNDGWLAVLDIATQ